MLAISLCFSLLCPKTFDMFQFNNYQMGLCYFNYILLYMLLCDYSRYTLYFNLHFLYSHSHKVIPRIFEWLYKTSNKIDIPQIYLFISICRTYMFLLSYNDYSKVSFAEDLPKGQKLSGY